MRWYRSNTVPFGWNRFAWRKFGFDKLFEIKFLGGPIRYRNANRAKTIYFRTLGKWSRPLWSRGAKKMRCIQMKSQDRGTGTTDCRMWKFMIRKARIGQNHTKGILRKVFKIYIFYVLKMRRVDFENKWGSACFKHKNKNLCQRKASNTQIFNFFEESKTDISKANWRVWVVGTRGGGRTGGCTARARSLSRTSGSASRPGRPQVIWLI